MTKSWVVVAALCLFLSGCSGGGDDDPGAVSGDAASASPVPTPGADSDSDSGSDATPAPDTSVPSAEPTAGEGTPDCPAVLAQKAILDGDGQGGTTLAFGQTKEWSNGLRVAVTAPEAFTPTPQAAGVDGEGTPVRVFVTVVNSGTTPFVGSDIWPTFTAGPGEASPIFDRQECLEGRTRDEIAPGGNVTYALGYVAGDPSTATLEIDPGMDLDPVTFKD